MPTPGVAFGYWLAGSLLALVVGAYLARQEGLSRVRLCFGFALLAIALFVGARAHAMLLEERRPLADLVTLHAWLGHGARLPGGFVLSFMLAPLVAAAVRLPSGSFANVALTAAASLIAVGRLACHFIGCCIGTPSKLPWAISYPKGTVAYAVHLQRGLIDTTATQSLPVHPFGLYMSGASAIVFACLLYMRHARIPHGVRALFGTTLLGLAFGVIEGFRDGVGNRLPLYRQEMWLLLAASALTGLVWLGIMSLVNQSLSIRRQRSVAL